MVKPARAARTGKLSAERLIGSWRLLSWEIRYPDGTVKRPFGRGAQGLLLYTPDGGMSASIAARGRRRAGDNPRLASAAEKARMLDSFFAYAGRYTIRGSQLRHRVTVALNPAMTGTLQLREATLVGDRLELSATEKSSGRGGERRHVLAWTRGRGPVRGRAAPRRRNRNDGD